MTTRSQTTRTTKTITLGRSGYGTLQPKVEIVMPRGTHFRSLRAELLKLAAEVELATAKKEGWAVGTDSGSDTTRWVFLELLDGTDAEAARGISLEPSIPPNAASASSMVYRSASWPRHR